MLASPRMANFRLLLQATLVLFTVCVDATLDPIVIVGSHFFYKTNGSEFFIRGVSYGYTASTNASTLDPLTDAVGCQRDIPYLQQLRTNVVRVHMIDPTRDHSKCMSLLDGAGIYVLVDLALGDGEDLPWDVELYKSFTSVIDIMQSYTNVLGFFAGSEVRPDDAFKNSTAFVKAAVRDMKAYIKVQNYRSMGIGIGIGSWWYDPNVLNFNNATVSLVEDYFNCGNNLSSIDFLGLGVYSWCGNSSSYTQSGYSDLTKDLSNYSVPVFLSGYGCNTGGGTAGRTFTEVEALYGSQMTDVFSGGIVYEYLEEANDFGLVSVHDTSILVLPDFNALSTQMASVSPSSTESSAYIITNTVARACPTIGPKWQASETLPPTPNSALCNCMFSSLSCVAAPGLNAAVVEPSLLSQICDPNPSTCLGIDQDATAGKYGAYSACNTTQRISWIMNQYYLSQNSASSSCNFGGRGKIQSVSSAGSQCQGFLNQAGPQGTGTVTSIPSSTGTGTGSGSSSRGLSTGAKAGIAIATVLVSILAGVGVFICGKKSMTKRAPVPVEGGLEFGEAPPEFTALGRAEMETNEIENSHIFKKEPMDQEPAMHDIQLDGNELSVGDGRQELDNTGVLPQLEHSELDGRAEISELSSPRAPVRGELSGDSRMRFELSPTNRKPLPGSVSPQVGQTTSHSLAPVSHSNTPWSNPGIEDLRSEGAQAAGPDEEADAAEMRRIEEEERRIDEAIAESERLQALRKQKEELQKRKLDMKARAGGRS